MRHILAAIFMMLLSVTLNVTPAPAQLLSMPEKPAEKTEAAPQAQAPDALGRDTPRGTVRGYLDAMAKADYTRAGAYFDFSALPEKDRAVRQPNIAKTFQKLLDQGGSIRPVSVLSDAAKGDDGDELDENLDRVGNFRVDGENVPIYVQKVADSAGAQVWLFSAETVKRIPAVFTQTNFLSVDKVLPASLVKMKWGGVSAGHWLVMAGLAVAAYLAAWALVGGIFRVVEYVSRRRNPNKAMGVVRAFALPIRLYSAVWILVFSAQAIGISIIVRQYFSKATVIVAWVAILILLWRLIDVFSAMGQRWMMRTGHLGALSTVMFFRRSMKFILIALGGITVLDTLGFNVTTGLTALGIGGIALALGAQKTVENLVGSLTVIFDQPVRVGDFCKVGETLGTVEQIGMRSTRIRTLDRTLVTIPNGDFSAQKIENYAYRDRFRFQAELGVRYETSPDQIRYLLVELRKILYAHARVAAEPCRVRFLGFGSDSLRIEVFAYILTHDYNEFLEIQEDLNLRIADILEASGTSLAFSSQTLYLARDSGLPQERKKQAEEKVAAWRKEKGSNVLQFEPDYIKSIENTIQYPPKQ